MEKLLFPADIAERYRCSLPTARAYMRRMSRHQEHPLAVTEADVIEWDLSRTIAGSAEIKKARYTTYKQAPPEGFHVPRKRPA